MRSDTDSPETRVEDGRLRVCQLISQFAPVASGAERQAEAQGRELVRRGHEVHVLTRAFPGLPRDEDLGGVIVHRWIRPIALGPLFGLSFVVGTIAAIREARRTFAPHLIHTHQALWEAIATGAGREWIGRLPVLAQPASSGYFGEALEMRRTRGFPILRRCAIRNPWFAMISSDLEREWRELGAPPDRMFRAASGVDADRFRPGPSAVEAELPPGPRVVFTGRLHPQKNLEFLIRAWTIATRDLGAPGTLLLVGDGPDRRSLEESARAAGIGDRVRFVGAVADPSEYLRASRIFVLPSVAEGMSNSLLEAMATGLPCLASRIGGNLDLIEPGRRGDLLPTDHPEPWARTLRDWLANPELAARLGAESRRLVEERHALPRVVDRYLEIYRTILGAGRDSAAAR